MSLTQDLHNPYGLKDSKIVYVDDVPRGLKCGCFCPACNDRLMAKHGDKRSHHFAHASNRLCGFSVESAVHRMCKEILNRERRIVLPPETADGGAVELKFDDVEIEKNIGDIRPDLIVHADGKPLIIEIYVWHKTDTEKIWSIEKLGIRAIEVSLTEFQYPSNRPDKSLATTLIENTTNKKWLRPPPIKVEHPVARPINPNSPYKAPFICRQCGIDVSDNSWTQHFMADNTYLCGRCAAAEARQNAKRW